MTTSMLRSPDSLREALVKLRVCGEQVIEVDSPLAPYLGIASHYRLHFATSPATRRSGDEPVVLYKASGNDMPVLMGLFGSRRRNEWLLGSSQGQAASHLGASLARPIRPVWRTDAPCHEHQLVGGLGALPILTSTAEDAGPYLTSGLVCAGDPDSGFVSISIHRMRVIDDHHLTIWILPGRDLDLLYRRALAEGRPLPVSINIGVPPALYVTSSLSKPFVRPGFGELETAGALLQKPIEIARCLTSEAFCIAQSEIVIEGCILGSVRQEFSNPNSRHSMPEFLGYMGNAQAALPLLAVSSVFHRRDALYQAFLGPGKEQSELLALPTEAGVLIQLRTALASEMEILDVHYLASGGGQLTVALKVRKLRESREQMARVRDAVITRHSLTKVIIVTDEDVDIRSSEDIIWALSTRFQPSRDIHSQERYRGFPLDPSQSIGYLDSREALTDKYVIDLTIPLALRSSFKRL